VLNPLALNFGSLIRFLPRDVSQVHGNLALSEPIVNEKIRPNFSTRDQRSCRQAVTAKKKIPSTRHPHDTNIHVQKAFDLRIFRPVPSAFSMR